MIPFISLEEAQKRQGGNGSLKLLTEDNGCVNGCSSGITVCVAKEFSDRPGKHSDQEGFFVLEGNGEVKLDDTVYEIKPGDSFIAMPEVEHTMRTFDENVPLKVFWFHSGI